MASSNRAFKTQFILDEIVSACAANACHEAAIRTVPIRQIRGSENRSGDFDWDFNPLHDVNSALAERRRGAAVQ